MTKRERTPDIDAQEIIEMFRRYGRIGRLCFSVCTFGIVSIADTAEICTLYPVK